MSANPIAPDPKPNDKRTTAFLTDSTLCIGCKACEVACKEWNQLAPDGFDWSGFSYDNTGAVGHSTWRHVKFVEIQPMTGSGGNAAGHASWEFSSDVCKHCEVAGCLEACPTESIKFGEIDELRLRAQERLHELHGRGMSDARLYDPRDTSVKGTHSMFLVRGDPRQYNLPPNPEAPTKYLRTAWTSAAVGSALFLAGALLAFTTRRRPATFRRGPYRSQP